MNAYQSAPQYRQRYRANDVNINVQKSAPKKKSYAELSAKDKKRILALIGIIGIVCIIAIILGAYAAKVNYENNKLLTSNATLQGEVQSLQVEVNTVNNVAAIEEKATRKLNMVYATGKQNVEISTKSVAGAKFAATLKKEAF